MAKFDGILFCTDLDGTLFRNDKTISKENLDAIEYFKSEGGLFTFITGRMPATSKDICAVVKPNVPFGCVNGGGIYDHRIGEYIWTATLPKEAIELVEYVDKSLPDIGIQFNTEKQIYFNKDNSAMVKFREVTNLPAITCNYTQIREPVLKVVFAHDEEERLYKLIELLNHHPKAENFDFIRSEHTLYEILPKGVSKGTALVKITQLLGLDINKTIAVGDYDNDISMICSAAMGFAVSNARSAVKAVADRITVGNEEHAIAKIIDELDKRVFNLSSV